MIVSPPIAIRDLSEVKLDADLVVIGGGMAGTCCAITAARAGIKVILIQDRPVLGGNASSEVRLWVLGATSHMGNNNRWAREGGVIDELLVENMYRNPEGNALIFDTILLEKVREEENITLLLNTAVFELAKSDADTIESVRAFCSQNSTMYQVNAPLFCDASGDGVVGFMAGAAFRMGAEAKSEFGELLAPDTPSNQLLGHSMYFYSKDIGKPVTYVPPSFALKDISTIPRWRSFNAKDDGCRLWWIEYGGLLDTVHGCEDIKWELWKVIYGVWNHIKNSGQFPEAENLTLEWVGTIPGKRESRRFEGDYMLTQQDIVERRPQPDTVSYGGWAIDLHPSEGVYSDAPPCTQWHSKGVYPIPYRSLYSRNIKNLFLAGRIISASHIAFGSTRVMGTCAHNAQAVALAAKLCKELDLLPRDISDSRYIGLLQKELLRTGQHLPGVCVPDTQDLAESASVRSSSTRNIASLEGNGQFVNLGCARAQLFPVKAGSVPAMTFWVDADEAGELDLSLMASTDPDLFTPEQVISKERIKLTPASSRISEVTTVAKSQLSPVNTERNKSLAVLARKSKSHIGEVLPQRVVFKPDVQVEQDQFLMLVLQATPGVMVAVSSERPCGLLALRQKGNGAVSKSDVQRPPQGSGIEAFPFWLPERRPGGMNLAMQFNPPLNCFDVTSIQHGPERPTVRPNAWSASQDDMNPWIELSWDQPQIITRIDIAFDTDHDHPMESVLMGHPERVMPNCVAEAVIYDDNERILGTLSNNYQTRWSLRLESPCTTQRIRIVPNPPDTYVPPVIFRVRCFGSNMPYAEPAKGTN
jgi:hypothetical protein